MRRICDEGKCTACGACEKTCPKVIIEIRPQGKISRRVYMSCVNKDKGAVARKACTVSCIGCGKCVKTCPFEAITLENNLAYIDPLKCKLCRKCVNDCPTGAIRLVGMEPLPKAPKTPVAPKPAAAVQAAAPAPAQPAAAARKGRPRTVWRRSRKKKRVSTVM